MLQETIEPTWLDAFDAVLRRCALAPGDVVAVLSESQSRPVLPELARVAAAIEGEKRRVRAAQPRRHVDLVRIGREVHQGPRLEAKQRRTWVAVVAVLGDGVPPGLARRRVLQLARRDRETIDRE